MLGYRSDEIIHLRLNIVMCRCRFPVPSGPGFLGDSAQYVKQRIDILFAVFNTQTQPDHTR